MKKILTLLILGVLAFSLSGCGESIYVEDETIAIVFENVRFEDSILIIDIYLTNGFDTDEYVDYMEFDIYSNDEELYIAGAGFDILETVPADDYIFFTIEFGTDYIFESEADIEASGYDLADVVLYYYYE